MIKKESQVCYQKQSGNSVIMRKQRIVKQRFREYEGNLDNTKIE